MLRVSKTSHLFVTSTFSDLKEERNALQARVFPRLRELCLQHDVRFQAIELRWAVRLGQPGRRALWASPDRWEHLFDPAPPLS